MKFLENKPSKAVSVIVFLGVAAAITVACVLIFGNGDAAVSAGAHKGSLMPSVCDGMSGAPIAGAVIVIPETKQAYVTGADGKTELITVPVIEDSEYKRLYAKTWGEVTLLVYAEGYIPYALFHTQVWENESRQGPNILMFEYGSTSSDQPISIIEGPQRLWVNELIAKYNPSGLASATPSQTPAK